MQFEQEESGVTVNSAKRRMMEGKVAIGAESGLGSPLSGELVSPLGFDFILVDTQHGRWADETAMLAFRGIGLGSAVPMARVRRNDYGLIGRLLDMGAMGIVVPMVNNAEEAEAAVFATRYPPRGGRSIGPFGTGFLGSDYDDWANDEIFLAVQIETAEGAKNAEEIMAVDGIDGCWIGPGDLSRFMRLDLSSPEGREAHTAAIRGVIEACGKTGKVPGISMGTAPDAQRWINEGCLFVTAGSDSEWVVDKARETLRYLGR
jgi:4-hydroxy-2-oxoheptanedioate aldolase